MERVVLHCDMNNFYASVECLYQPKLRGRPVAVAGDVEQRHGIVLAKNYEAKRFGVATGNPLWMAKQLCPEIIFVPPHFDRYLQFSALAREIYSDYTDQVESFGLDECWLDVSGSTHLLGDGRTIADELRRRIKYELGITASVGVSFNKIFAKLGSDLKKPDATTVITRDNYRDVVWPLPMSDLLYVGPATARKLQSYAIHTIGDLALAHTDFLRGLLGKIGLMLWSFANGHDASAVTNAGVHPVIKSVGNSTTTPKDLVSDDDVKITLFILCESVAERLREQNFQCDTVQISMRYVDLWSCERQLKLDFPICNSESLFQAAFHLYQKHRLPDKAIRSLGVRACGLSLAENIQISFLPEISCAQRQDDLEHAVDDIRRRFGHFIIQRGIALTDHALSHLDPKADHVIHPVGFLK
ncbi:DNA polymerase IV [Anaeromassilibacillus senegalensis]|uniref:DNA polymerase IV n=1 Tax=Anaeromassilibacillus senegalensis TaxID=1673717 RepID=UPI000682756D|nr:DNA polymerase IV [Anaeromassilibacillus senegalensis]